MPRIHKIKPGEHLSSIAESYGFANFEAIWNDPGNKGLRECREDPHVLFPGDEVVIPDVPVRSFERAVDRRCSFEVHVESALLRLQLLDPRRQPIANATGTLEAGGQEQTVTTDGDGILEARVPRNTTRAHLEIGEREYELVIGHLDPVGCSTGNLGRLHNLAFSPVSWAQPGAAEARALRLALERLENSEGTPPQGQATAELLGKLRERHGC